MIRLIVTGGTFDKQYDELSGTMDFRESHLPEILKTSRCTVPVEVEMLQMIDSLYMNDLHRVRIVDSCTAAKESQIIITHGTDTMVETARKIAKHVTDKTVVLTGAMIPYTVQKSDAVFNLGCAIIAVQELSSGTYIVMNGKVFLWNKVRKNKEEGLFETIADY